MAENSVFDLVGATKTYFGHRALDQVDLAIEEGRVNAVIGPSGSGKTTVIRLLVGLVRPDGGNVLFRNQDLAELDLAAMRRKLGYVIQEGGLFPHLTARANVTLVARQIGRSADWIAGRVSELAGLVQIEHRLLDNYPGELSGGQRQRIALMRALMLDPDVLLLDEPLGALDPMIRHRLQEDLKQIFADLGKTVVLVTHDLPEAAYLADRLILMRTGRIEQEGTPSDLTDRPASTFVREFLNAQRHLHDGGAT